MPNDLSGPLDGPLPPLGTEAARQRIRDACERWNARVCPFADCFNVPGFLADTDRLIEWRDAHAGHLDVAPLARFKNILLRLARAVGEGGRVEIDAALEGAHADAVDAVHRIFIYAGTGDTIRKGKPGGPTPKRHFDEEDRKILRVMASNPRMLFTVKSMWTAVRRTISQKTIGARLIALITDGMAVRPHGSKSGAGITEAGLAVAAELPPEG
jgi:hypothetical protein